ncbi:precorrin-2/cobalt-factor-2 C20-methyltransferase [Halalkaliarchaeum desulfuricum]|uniref:Precorrin-2/cobalt-factor-2 C20-methyltransferase n=1 Tax=Halalkaliarchaeum desulfuricum TaxID=2055893 RepID=A0A343TNY2_9EURY|nr:precorrin-2/cobalt-factor-2 C20-methyltransferase [Halalkaliarchaeum desulfuricum]
MYGIGLGPGDAGLLTLEGKRLLEAADTVYASGDRSRSVAGEHVPESTIEALSFPMTDDDDRLRRAWRTAARRVAEANRDGDVAVVTLGDPNVYSTFGHLRRTLEALHPDVEIEVIPGVSAATAFASALGVEIEAGSGIALREAIDGAAPVGPDRLVLFKVTDAAATAEKLDEAGYDVRFGRQLFMEDETVMTDDPDELTDGEYFTLAYAEKRDLDREFRTEVFRTEESRTEETRTEGDR